MSNTIKSIAFACIIAVLHPNGSCQICCESENIRICKFYTRCAKQQEDEKPDVKFDPNRSDDQQEVSHETK